MISTLFLFIALAAMLYLNVGQVSGLYVSINEAKNEASSKLNDKDLPTLTIANTEFTSGRAVYLNSKEIRYNGSLYDIASSTNDGANVIFKVLHDEKEEGLLSRLKETVERWGDNAGSNGKHPISKHSFVIKDFMPADRYTFNANSSLIQIFAISYSHATASPLLAVIKSPPKLG